MNKFDTLLHAMLTKKPKPLEKPVRVTRNLMFNLTLNAQHGG